jgi:hypothetical protein
MIVSIKHFIVGISFSLAMFICLAFVTLANLAAPKTAPLLLREGASWLKDAMTVPRLEEMRIRAVN